MLRSWGGPVLPHRLQAGAVEGHRRACQHRTSSEDWSFPQGFRAPASGCLLAGFLCRGEPPDCGTNCGTRTSGPVQARCRWLDQCRIFGLLEPSTTENAPPGRRGASGVTTGRRDMYLYICGSVGGRWALLCRVRPSWEAMGAMISTRDPTKKFLSSACIGIST